MTPAAASPEELDTLLEDALLLADTDALTALFAAGDVVVVGTAGACRGGPAVASLVGRAYVSRQQVRLRQGVALVVGDATLTVASRAADGGWHLLAVVLLPGPVARR